MESVNGDYYCRETEPLPSKKKEMVNHPSHYQGKDGMECIDIIESYELDFKLGSALKYILRAGRKDPSKKREDLEKAIWYLKRSLREEE